jgi:hypothetical protein
VAKDDDDDLFDTVSGMADRLELKGKERQTYVHEHMTRGGYRMEPSYVKGDPDDDDDDGGSGFFGSNRNRSGSGSRNDSRSRSRSRRSRGNDDDW